MTDRLRQSEESAEQARQHLERTAGQMLEERMSRTEASVRDRSLSGGWRERHLELTKDEYKKSSEQWRHDLEMKPL